MTDQKLFVFSINDRISEVAKSIAQTMGRDVVLLHHGDLREGIREAISNSVAICVVPNPSSPSETLIDAVCSLASKRGCVYWEWDHRNSIPHRLIAKGLDQATSDNGLAIILEGTLSDIEVANAIAGILGSGFTEPIQSQVPFQWLYEQNFRHVQQESNWINSRFMWFMFAMSALLASFSAFRDFSAAWIFVGAGLIISLGTFCLQITTFIAEAAALEKCNETVSDWKKEVPQIGKYLFDTPAGGNSLFRHGLAKFLMLSMILVFVAVWGLLIAGKICDWFDLPT